MNILILENFFNGIIPDVKEIEKEVKDLLFKGRVNEAFSLAVDIIKRDGSKESFLQAIDVMVVKRDIKNLKKFLRLYKKRFGMDKHFWNYYATYCFRTLKVDRLMKILRYTDKGHTFWILSSYGYTQEAEKISQISKNPLRKMQINILRGKFFESLDENHIKSVKDYMLYEVLYKKLLITQDIISGNFDNILAEIDEHVDEMLDMGFVGYALDLMFFKSLFDKHSLFISKEIAKSLGDRYTYTKLLLVESIWKGYVSIPKFPNVPMLEVLYSYVLYTLGQLSEFKRFSGLEGMYYLWWYVDKIHRDRMYLKFSGYLKLMKGNKEIKLPKKQLIILAYIKSVGRKRLMERAGLLFEGSKNPRRRIFENIARLGDYRICPTDLEIAYKSGNLLSNEKGFWVNDIKEYCRKIFG